MQFVIDHTIRGECQCGRCLDAGSRPDPTDHVVDMVFFKVGRAGDWSDMPALVEQFRALTESHQGVFVSCDPFFFGERDYMTLGAWIGDQGLALQYMALGVLLGVFALTTPYTLLRLNHGDKLALRMAEAGMVIVVPVKRGVHA